MAVEDYLYEPGTGLEVPGIESVLEYGDASAYEGGRIPGALRINDRSKPDQVHVTELTGLHDDPDVSDSRTERAGNFGERAGLLFPRGRTVGVTGYVKAGNVGRMRDLWRRTRAQFGRFERDLIVHPPRETVLYRNEAWMDASAWTAARVATDGGTIAALAAYTEGNLTGIEHSVTFSSSGANGLALVSKNSLPWRSEDVWLTALVKVQAAAGSVSSLSLVVYCCDDNDQVLKVWSPAAPLQATPSTGSYYRIKTRLLAEGADVVGTRFYAVVLMNTSTAGAHTLRATQVSAVLVNAQDPAPAGYVGGNMPGFEWDGAPGRSPSYGPCYAVNQVSDPSSEETTLWGNESSGGVTVETGGAVVHSWPEGASSSSWSIRNPDGTSRTISVRSPATLADPRLFIVTGGRSYRIRLDLRVKEMFATGRVSVVWLNHNLAAVNTSVVDLFDPVDAGDPVVDVTIEGVLQAPALAQRAYLRVDAFSASSTTGDRMNVLLADPTFVDVSDYDPGDVTIDSSQEREHGIAQLTPSMTGGVLSTTGAGARRRIPRPFLLRKVRALWDGKAPESQRGLSARRDFTMSLRASDPLIYSLDERHASVRASGTPEMVNYPASAHRALLLQAPTLVASDNFNVGVNGSINARVAPLGGTWTTSGTTPALARTNFGSLFVVGQAAGSDASPRWATLGSASYVDVKLEVLSYQLLSFASSHVEHGFFARWVDSSNYLRVVIVYDIVAGTSTLNVVQRVAGSDTVIATATGPTLGPAEAWYGIRATVSASGRVSAWLLDGSKSSTLAYTSVNSTALATGGALATGKIGLVDFNSSATATRFLDDFLAYTLAADASGVPAGFTSFGTSVDPKVSWATSMNTGASFLRDGVGLGQMPPSVGLLSQDSLVRGYRTQEGYTYTTPQVTVAGDCVSSSSGHDYSLLTDALIGGAWRCNYLAALVKRVNSTTWLELRYNSANAAVMNAAHASPTAPSSLELWCSHTTGGTLTTTRLDAWDVPASVITSGALKFVRAYMTAGNQVFMELWSDVDPNPGDVGLVSRRAYTLPSALVTLLGAAVAGTTGFGTFLSRWGDGTAASVSLEKMAVNYGFPYLSSFDAIDYAATQLWLSCPVIGDSDRVPWRLQLRGNLISPTIVLTSFGEEIRSATVRLSGTFLESDPVTIDFAAGTIRAESGANYFSTRQPGTRFEQLAAGQNFVLIQAANWDTAATVHAIASWQDALL